MTMTSGSEMRLGNRFIFEMDGVFKGGFSKVKRIERKIPRFTYMEGGRNTHPLILAQQHTELQQLVLEKGFIEKNPMLKSMHNELVTQKQVFSSGTLMVLDEREEPVRIFSFDLGVVSEWTTSDLDSIHAGIIIDSITVHHTGLVEVFKDR
ncbi:hypothetical protein F9B85_10370 [Heliorestis acidaminivorans]|uniref:Phage tail protein n=1 Tax=Heliorestis acidaminivorans TaxID=553427 RepID=A0A6I0F0S4_9FIRM|nr:phage tail protein [Heliorestis acidaminivorans]KAB2951954.1 hypothetical protein F9B85_10370 [Heliorestis acidaminivorans]